MTEQLNLSPDAILMAIARSEDLLAVDLNERTLFLVDDAQRTRDFCGDYESGKEQIKDYRELLVETRDMLDAIVGYISELEEMYGAARQKGDARPR